MNHKQSDKTKIAFGLKNLYSAVAMKIRQLRREKKISQETLAKRIGVKQEFVSYIESGKHDIALDVLYRIADAMGKEFHFAFK